MGAIAQKLEFIFGRCHMKRMEFSNSLRIVDRKNRENRKKT